MESSRGRRPRSPERQRPAAARKVPVVYYLTRSRHLDHPHLVEVPAPASPEGLYLRDVVSHLNMVRGKGVASMYSWSCKRKYKNGFVWHDLAEDDLLLPATDGEYILKGSELVDQSSSGQFYHGGNGNDQKQQSCTLKDSARQPLPRETSYPSPPPGVMIREARSRRSPSVPPPDEDDTPSPCRGHSTGTTMSPELDNQGAQFPASGSASPAEFRVHKPTAGCMDAATQTDDLVRKSSHRATEMRKKSLSTDHDAIVREVSECRQSHPRRSAELQGISGELSSQCPTPTSIPSTRGMSENLESLIRADNATTDSFRVIQEDGIIVPSCPKLKPANVLMQLITCGSLSVKDHENIGIVQAYKPRFPPNLKFPSPLISRTVMMGELDYLSENPRLMGMKLEEKEYFSGSLIETKMHRKDIPAERYSALKRSSSYNAERSSSEALDRSRPDEDSTDTSRSRCLPRTPLLPSFLLHNPSKSETRKSPVADCRSRMRSSSAKQEDCFDLASGDGSGRFAADAAPARTESTGSFRKEERLVKIEERLSSGARVVIQYTVPCNDRD